uniref:Ig-like domain-containing protein n=1 Tax=Oncorhynchus kisutch TaxID=8019 RepID=A0A8C7CTV3_ONCKI
MISLMLGLLMLMLMLLHGVVTFPLELNPPRVVVRYGDSVSVNCSTSATDHDGMGWEATFGGISLEQDVNVVTWTVDNLTDWTIEPKCYINLIDGEQPSIVLPVILYKTPDRVSISVLNHSGPMVEGTQYQLQCDIQNTAPLQNLVVKWYKGNETLDIVTYSNRPEDVSATLMISPNRNDDGAQYRCRAELDLGPEGPQPHPTVTSEPLSITVHYAPEFLPGNDTVEVSAGSDVSLDCSAEGNPPPELRWTNNTAEGNAIETTVGRLRNLNISRVTANATYNCTVTNRLGSITKQIHVLVDVPPQQHPTMFSTAPSTPDTMTTLPGTAKPKVVTFPLELNPPRVVVRYGDSVSVNCSTSATDHDGMGWEATFGGISLEQDVNVVTWTVDNLTDWTIEPKCYINLIDGEQPSIVLPVILYKTPDRVSISVLNHSGPMVEGTQYQLQCDIQNIAPLQNLVVKWYKGNETLDIVTYSNRPEDVSATLMISPNRNDDGAQYRCRAELDLGPEGPQPHPTVTSEPLSITVHYAPEFLPGNDTVEVSAGSDVSLDCSAEGNPPPELRWTNNTAEGNAIETTVGRLRNLNISRVTANATYNCTVTNRLGSITKQIHVLVDVPPQQHPTMFSTAPSTPDTMTTLPGTAKPKVVTFPLELNPPRVVVRYGDSVSVNCSTSATDHDGMGWEATFGGISLEQDVNVVTWTVDNLTDWTIEPKCYINLIDGEQPSIVLPVILYSEYFPPCECERYVSI